MAEAAEGHVWTVTSGSPRHIIFRASCIVAGSPASQRKRGTMLEFYFSYRGVLKRLRSGALGAEMDRIAGDLFSQGYKPASPSSI